MNIRKLKLSLMNQKTKIITLVLIIVIAWLLGQAIVPIIMKTILL